MALGRLTFELPAILGCLLAIATIAVVEYTFKRLSSVLNFSILGVHPLANVANAIDSVIVAGCQDAINTLEKWSMSLLKDMLATLEFAAALIILFVALIVKGIAEIYATVISPQIDAITGAAGKSAAGLAAKVEALARTAASDVARLEHRITSGISALRTEVFSYVTQEADSIETDMRRELGVLRDLIPQTVRDVAAAEDLITGKALEGLRNAEDAAIGAVSQAENATARELHDLLGTLDLTDLAKIVGAVPVIAALVNVLMAETGLSNAECRAKVKGICGTNPTQWFRLLEGLAISLAWPGIREFADDLADVAGEVTREITDFVGV